MFIQSKVIDIFPKFKMAAAAILDFQFMWICPFRRVGSVVFVFCTKFGSNICYSHWDRRTYALDLHLMTSRELTSDYDFWSRGHLRMAPKISVFGGFYPQNLVAHRSDPQKARSWAERRVLSPHWSWSDAQSLPSKCQILSANQISSWYLNWRLRYNYFRFRNTNVRHLGILLPVSI